MPAISLLSHWHVVTGIHTRLATASRTEWWQLNWRSARDDRPSSPIVATTSEPIAATVSESLVVMVSESILALKTVKTPQLDG